MQVTSNSTEHPDPFDLRRFIDAQDGVYERALGELRAGKKRSHWMWYIFPQIDGLGFSATSKRYAIKSLEEARAYLQHPVLGARLAECAETLLTTKGRSASQIFGFPDDAKLRSSMTLFAHVAGPDSVYHLVLEAFFGGVQDDRTLEILTRLGGESCRN